MKCTADLRISVVGVGVVIHTLAFQVLDYDWERAQERIGQALPDVREYLLVQDGWRGSIRTTEIVGYVGGRRLAPHSFQRSISFRRSVPFDADQPQRYEVAA